MGVWLAGAVKMSSIRPLVESEPPGCNWSISRIQDFRNHKRNKNHFYIIQFFRTSEKRRSEIDINKILWNNDMVPKIFEFIDRPNLTRWFRLNQWSNRAHLDSPGKPDAQILWLSKRNRNCIRRARFLRSQSQVSSGLEKWKIVKSSRSYKIRLISLK